MRTLVVLAAAATTAVAQTPLAAPQPATIVVKAARMLDVVSGRMLTNASVVITGDKIVAVNPASPPANARVIDLGDATLMPGFIDLHTHLTGEIGAGSFTEPVTTTEIDGAIVLTCEERGTPPPPPPPGSSELVINEIDYDQVGADSGGFIEIYNAGDAAADLTDVSLVLLDGGTGNEYLRRTLTGTLAAGGYLLGGDHRYAQLLAMTAAGALIAFAPSPSRPVVRRFATAVGVAAVLAAVVLFTEATSFPGASAALPVVAARATGSTSLVADGVTGRLVDPADREAYADALALYCTDTDARRAAGTAGLDASRRYSWDAVNAALVDGYLDVTRRRVERVYFERVAVPAEAEGA